MTLLKWKTKFQAIKNKDYSYKRTWTLDKTALQMNKLNMHCAFTVKIFPFIMYLFI
jgi:hypothetical protein